jgi:phosphoglycolate phosphatase
MAAPLTIPRALIFDWDNTLVDSWEAIAQSINYVRGEFGHPEWTLAEIKTNCTRAARDSFPEWFGADWQKAYDLYYQRFDQVRKSAKIRPLPGSVELLRWLKTQKIPAFVVSNKHGNYLRLEAATLKWQDFFAAIVGAQDAIRDKPARDPVDHALGQTSLTAHADIWFAGDSEVDVQCARNAGCTPVFIGDAATAARLSVARVFSDCQALQAMLYNAANNDKKGAAR